MGGVAVAARDAEALTERTVWKTFFWDDLELRRGVDKIQTFPENFLGFTATDKDRIFIYMFTSEYIYEIYIIWPKFILFKA